MGYLVIALLTALLAWADVVIVQTLRRRRARLRWWVALSIAWLIGASLGTWGGFFFEYRPSSRLRVLGAPVPVVAFQWEGAPGQEQWIDYVPPAPMFLAAANVLILTLAAACPVGAVFWLTRRRVASGLAASHGAAFPGGQ